MLSQKYEVDEVNLSKALNRLKNKKSLLFTMSGKMGAGKDTVGNLISKELISKGYRLINTSFGYLIRNEITDIVNGYRKANDKEKYAIKVNANKKDLDKLYYYLQDCTAFDRTDETRAALQFWGTEIRRKQQDNYWINKMSEFIVNSVNSGLSVNVTDARFPNEVDLIKDLAGKIIRLDVPEEIRIKRIEERDNIKVNPESLNHISETALDNYNFERVFDGTKDPHELCREGVNYIINM